jgi:hypothetical protein
MGKKIGEAKEQHGFSMTLWRLKGIIWGSIIYVDLGDKSRREGSRLVTHRLDKWPILVDASSTRHGSRNSIQIACVKKRRYLATGT